MQRFLLLLFTLAFSGLGCSSSKPEPPPPKINISIVDFEARSGVTQGDALTVADAFGSLLTNTNRFVVIDRKQIVAVLQEQGFQSSQSPESGISKAASILAVRKLISGSLGKLGDNYILSVKMTDVESSGIDLSISRTYDDDLEDIMDEFLPNLVQEIVASIDSKRTR